MFFAIVKQPLSALRYCNFGTRFSLKIRQRLAVRMLSTAGFQISPPMQVGDMLRRFRRYVRVTVYSFPFLSRSECSPVDNRLTSSTLAAFTSTDR